MNKEEKDSECEGKGREGKGRGYVFVVWNRWKVLTKGGSVNESWGAPNYGPDTLYRVVLALSIKSGCVLCFGCVTLCAALQH